MTYVLLVILALVAGLYLLPFLLTWGEKEHLRGDLIPKPYEPGAWKSPYLEGRAAEARHLGLAHCGDFHTGPHASMVKGPMRLYLNKANTAIIAIVSARFAGMELKKTFIRSRLADGLVIETNDSGGVVDITGGTDRTVLWKANLDELLEAHEARLQTASHSRVHTTPAEAFAHYELIETARGQRMVDQKLATWTDPSHSLIRRTIKGALATMRANKTQTVAIAKSERQRMEAAKSGAGR